MTLTTITRLHKIRRWLQVDIYLEWPYRRADLHLDGSLVAPAVPFVSASGQDARELHIFNFDAGVVWWDNLVVRGVRD